MSATVVCKLVVVRVKVGVVTTTIESSSKLTFDIGAWGSHTCALFFSTRTTMKIFFFESKHMKARERAHEVMVDLVHNPLFGSMD